MAPGRHRIVLRGTGVNGDSQKVTHLTQLFIDVATGGGANDNYIDIVGFAVMRIAAMDANTISAYAITPVIADMNDPLCAAVRWRGWCLELAGRARHTDFPGGATSCARPTLGGIYQWNGNKTVERGKFIVILGVVLALAAGGAAFFLITRPSSKRDRAASRPSAWSSRRDDPARKPVGPRPGGPSGPLDATTPKQSSSRRQTSHRARPCVPCSRPMIP